MKVRMKKGKEQPRLERIGAVWEPQVAGICCGCICVDKCFWNSPGAMKNVANLVNAGRVKLPSEMVHLIESESIKKIK